MSQPSLLSRSLLNRSAHLLQRLQNPSYLSQRGLEAYRVFTSPWRLLPEFLIIGVQKGGTTSLYRYLEQHPSIASAFTKEVHFFDNHTRDHKYGKGMSWYRSHFVYNRSKTVITGEGSPDYIFDLHAPHRIAQALPQAKLIVLLRNPVDRAYSHYLHNARASWDPHREPLSFEAAIAAEPERLRGEKERLLQDDRYFSYSYMHYSYLLRGHYAAQLQTWFQLYPRDQLLILGSEAFFADPRAAFKQVLTFLELPDWDLPEYQSFNARSEGAAMLDAAMRSQLIAYFKPHNQQLYQLLGQTFDWDR